jgi:hypothetical protein
MTAEQFVYWLQGYMEIEDPKVLDYKQTQIIKDHLALVFKKETPTRTLLTEQPNTYPPPVTTNPYTVTCTDTKTNIIC